MKLIVAVMLAGSMLAQDFSQLKVERVAAGYKFTEGPVLKRPLLKKK